MPKASDLTDAQRARLDQAFAMIRDNSERTLHDAVQILTSPGRAKSIAQQIERIIRTTDKDLFVVLAGELAGTAGADGGAWDVVGDALAMLRQANHYRDGANVTLFDPFAPDDDDEDY
jgi:hypothetical protein